MKKYIINKCINYIKKYNNYTEEKLKEIKYGLESIYLTFSKLITISIISILLGVFKEMITYLLIYNLLRLPSFGLHATKSWICLLSSTILFIFIPIICLNIKIELFLKTIIGIICILFMYKNSPADTYKKPIVSKKRRNIYKTISTIVCIIFCFISLYIKSNFLSNCLIFAMIMQNCMISPITYKIFKLPYNNYINYIKTHPDLILD